MTDRWAGLRHDYEDRADGQPGCGVKVEKNGKNRVCLMPEKHAIHREFKPPADDIPPEEDPRTDEWRAALMEQGATMLTIDPGAPEGDRTVVRAPVLSFPATTLAAGLNAVPVGSEVTVILSETRIDIGGSSIRALHVKATWSDPEVKEQRDAYNEKNVLVIRDRVIEL